MDGKSYDPTLFRSLFEVEDKHFWFRARNQVIAGMVAPLVSSLAPGYRVLEVGCGTGNVLRILKQVCSNGTVFGMDLFAEGLVFAAQRTNASLVQGDMHHPPFFGGFDVIGLFDVLEHLSDDAQVLRDIHRMLVPEGALVLTVPAHPQLWSYFDEVSRHVRRYTLDELTRKLEAAGYNVESTAEYMMSLFPWVWLRRIRSRGQGSPSIPETAQTSEAWALQELRIVPLVNEILSLVFSIEGRWLIRHGRLPWGTSIVSVARKGR